MTDPRWWIGTLVTLVVCLGSAGPATADEGWRVVFREDFRGSRMQLEKRGWVFESSPSRFVVPLDPAGGGLRVRVEPRQAGLTALTWRHRIDRGKEYRVRAQMRAIGVQDDPSRKGSRGAVVFAPFAAEDGAWIRGGAFPQGLKGDSDTQIIIAGPVNVFPTDAVYVRIMLGIEGYGEAVFDWAVLEERPSRAQPALVEPAEGAHVPTAHPTFTWKSSLKEPDVRVELRTAPRAEASGVDLTASGVETLQARKPLAPGAWHWRVLERPTSLDIWQVSDWRSFVVQPDDADGPLIVEPLWRQRREDSSRLTAYIHGAAPPQGVRAWIGDRETRVEPDADGLFHFVLQGALSAGIHEVRIDVPRPDGRTETHHDLFVNTQTGSDVRIVEGGWLRVDGKPFFPIGTYRDPSDRLDDFEGVREAGFNLTHSYQFEESAGGVEPARAYLRRAHEAGLKVFMGLPRRSVRADDRAAVRRWVAELMDEPALLSWYLFDEPEVDHVGAYRLAHLRREIAAIDPWHPTSLVLSCPELSGYYAAGCDLLWVDPYPVPDKPLVMVEQWVRQARDEADSASPVWAVLGVHDIRYWGKPEQVMAKLGPPTRPTYEELRCMTHLALASGAQGLIYYWGPNSIYDLRHDAPEVWDGLCRVIDELNELRPFLEARPEAGPTIASVRTWTSVAERERLIVLVNPEPQPASVSVSQLPWRVSGDMARDTPTLRFAPYEVVVIRTDE